MKFIPGVWSADYNKVLYPYSGNDLVPRTHYGYLTAAKEAVRKSNSGKEVDVNGIKSISTLLNIFNYPTQIV